MSEESSYVITRVFDNLKKITPALATVAIVCGLITFLPNEILRKMKLNMIPENISIWISLVFLASVALIIVIIITNFLSNEISKHKNRKIMKHLKLKLLNLNHKQKNIIIQILSSSERGLRLNYCDGDVRYLEEYTFITRTTNSTLTALDGEIVFMYMPQLWLIDLYNKEPELFK